MATVSALRQKYEYVWLDLCEHELVKFLNQWGESGWELDRILSTKTSASGETYACLLKRIR